MRDSLPGGNVALAELVDLFLADLPERLAAIRAATERADAPALALHAHALRSSAGNFGAEALDRICALLEQAGRDHATEKACATLVELADEAERVRRALLAVRSTG